ARQGQRGARDLLARFPRRERDLLRLRRGCDLRWTGREGGACWGGRRSATADRRAMSGSVRETSAMAFDSMSLDDLAALVNAAARTGMQPAVWARLQPERIAVYDYAGQTRTFGELNANANRLARRLREAGLKAGEGVALACSNRVEFCEALLAALRTF